MLALVVDTSAHPRAAHPRAICHKCYNESISLTTRLALNEFQASYYSHHMSKSALGETNWLLRASGWNLTLNPYIVIQMGHHHGHPLTEAMELHPDHWSMTLKVSPRDSKELCTDTDQPYSHSQRIFTMHRYTLIVPTFKVNAFSWIRPNPFQLITNHPCIKDFHLISLSCLFDTNHVIKIAC